MAIKMVREPNETPNISNIDDIIPMRYAYGNQSGYVINKGNQVSYTVNGLNFTINSGRLVLQGVECDIDASGVTVTIDNIATKRYYTVYLQVNLGVNTATVLATYDTTTYPNPPASDDLTANSTGVAYLILYHFTATGGIISEVDKIVTSVKYTEDIKVKNTINSDTSTMANNIVFNGNGGVNKVVLPFTQSGNIFSNDNIDILQVKFRFLSTFEYDTAYRFLINSNGDITAGSYSTSEYDINKDYIFQPSMIKRTNDVYVMELSCVNDNKTFSVYYDSSAGTMYLSKRTTSTELGFTSTWAQVDFANVLIDGKVSDFTILYTIASEED